MTRRARFDEGKLGDFLSKHDLVYERPPALWDRGLPLANSTVSALIWGDQSLKVSLDRADVWEMRRFEPDPEKFKWREYCKLLAEGRGGEYRDFAQTEAGPTPQRLPIGRFELSLRGTELHDYGMRLSLHDAMATGSYGTAYGGIDWACYVSANHPAVVFHYELSGEEEAELRFQFVSELGVYTTELAETSSRNPFRASRAFKFVRGYPEGLPEFAQILKDWGYPDPERFEEGDVAYFKQAIPENGNYAVAWTVLDHGEKKRTIIVSLTHDRIDGKAEVQAAEVLSRLGNPTALAVDEAAHRRWWHEYYPQSFFSFPDTRMEALYWIEMYKLGCVARPDGVAPTMGGPWTPDDGLPAFIGNDYHWNMQQQGNLMPIYTANRLDLGLSTYELLVQGRPEMAKYCRAFFEVDGEFLPHCTDLDCKPMYVNPDQFEFISGPWMCQHMWLHYRYSLDEEFLREQLYPMMREQVKPMIGCLETWDDGKLHLPYTMSAEYQGEQESIRWSLGIDTDWTNRFGPDATSDLAYLRFLCDALMEASDILDIADEDRSTWATTLRDLAPFTEDRFGGLMVRADLALESSHRHLSHLFPIHLLHLVDYDDPEGRALIDNSLYVLRLRGTGEWMGWTFSETAKIAILAHKPALARMLLLEYVDKYVHENTFDLEGTNYDCGLSMHGNYGLTLESDGMFAAAVQDFACRSFNDVLYVFDVLPEAWDDVSFWNFRAEGAFLVSARRRGGRTEFISIFSERGGTVRLVSDLGPDVDVRCGDAEVETRSVDKRLVFETRGQEEYVIYRSGVPPADLWITPVEDKVYERNYFGVKRKSRY